MPAATSPPSRQKAGQARKPFHEVISTRRIRWHEEPPADPIPLSDAGCVVLTLFGVKIGPYLLADAIDDSPKVAAAIAADRNRWQKPWQPRALMVRIRADIRSIHPVGDERRLILKRSDQRTHATLYRVKDSRGRVLLDLARDYEARAAAKYWNSRPVGKEFPAKVVALAIEAEEMGEVPQK